MSFQHLSIPDCSFYSILNLLLYEKISIEDAATIYGCLKIFQHLPMFLFLFLSIRNQTPECVIFCVLLKLLLFLLLAISALEFEKFCKINLKNAKKLWFRGVKTIVHFSILNIHKFTCQTSHFLFICYWKFIAFIKLTRKIFCLNDDSVQHWWWPSHWKIYIFFFLYSCTHNWTWMNLIFITVFFFIILCPSWCFFPYDASHTKKNFVVVINSFCSCCQHLQLTSKSTLFSLFWSSFVFYEMLYAESLRVFNLKNVTALFHSTVHPHSVAFCAVFVLICLLLSQNRIVVVSFYRWLICDSRLWRKSIFGKDKKQHSFTVILTRLTRNESFIGRGKELRWNEIVVDEFVDEF